MGTDIWIHIEYRSRKTKNYKYAREFYGDRLYGVFGILAGERSEIEPIYPPRGLPNDITRLTYKKYKDDEPDFHTASWLTSSELRECLDAVDEIIKNEKRDNYNKDWLKCYEKIYRYMKYYDDVGEPSRMVFWFDN